MSFTYTFLDSLLNNSTTFKQAIVGALLLICLYGIMFWIAFIILLAVLDLLLIMPNFKNIRTKLIVEWGIISTPFIYWAIQYDRQRWLFIIVVITFFVTQLIRGNLIRKSVSS